MRIVGLIQYLGYNVAMLSSANYCIVGPVLALYCFGLFPSGRARGYLGVLGTPHNASMKRAVLRPLSYLDIGNGL